MFDVKALRGPLFPPVSFALRAGDILMLHGPSGAGKSQILRALADMSAHDGQIYLDGRSQHDHPPDQWRRLVSLLPAESGWWSDRVGDHFPLALPEGWLARLHLPANAMDWEVSRLSSGERQRLALLRALVNQPRVLLLDEPTANLDGDNSAAMEALIREYLRDRPACAVWVSHDPAERERLASRSLEVRPANTAGENGTGENGS